MYHGRMPYGVSVSSLFVSGSSHSAEAVEFECSLAFLPSSDITWPSLSRMFCVQPGLTQRMVLCQGVSKQRHGLCVWVLQGASHAALGSLTILPVRSGDANANFLSGFSAQGPSQAAPEKFPKFRPGH